MNNDLESEISKPEFGARTAHGAEELSLIWGLASVKASLFQGGNGAPFESTCEYWKAKCVR